MSAVILLLFLGAPPDGDAGLPVSVGADDSTFRVQMIGAERETYRFGMSASLQGRVAIPFGAADRGDTFVSGNVIVITNRMSYLELFSPGLGFTIEADLMARPPPPRPEGLPWERSPAMGGYVALEWDWFDGGSATDDSGTRIEPDTLRLPQVYVGFKAQGTVQDNFFGELRFGLGAAHFPSLKAKVAPVGFAPRTLEFFEEAWTFAMELRLHFGWKAGPFAFTFGLGGRLIAPPESGAGISMDPAELWTLDFEAGVQIGF